MCAQCTFTRQILHELVQGNTVFSLGHYHSPSMVMLLQSAAERKIAMYLSSLRTSDVRPPQMILADALLRHLRGGERSVTDPRAGCAARCQRVV